MSDGPGAAAVPLEGVEARRWAAMSSAFADASTALVSGDAEGAAAALAQAMSVKVDMARVRNALHVPDDAGEFASGLEAILRRIPDGWGRWISCDRGWYPLLVRLNAELAAIAPEYEVYQVKEKFGGLRYYVGLPELDPECCMRLARQDPRPVPGSVDRRWAPKDRTPEQQDALEAWWVRQEEHAGSASCRAAQEALEPARRARRELLERLRLVVDAAESASLGVCEVCGGSGSAALRARRYLVKTVCDGCADEFGYVLVGDGGPVVDSDGGGVSP